MPETSQPKPDAASTISTKQPAHIGKFRTSAAQFLASLILMLFVASHSWN